MSKVYYEFDHELINGDVVIIEGSVDFIVESAYGADLNNNRGVYKEFMDDIKYVIYEDETKKLYTDSITKQDYRDIEMYIREEVEIYEREYNRE